MWSCDRPIGRATDRSDRSPRVNTPLLHGTVVVGVSQTAALNTGRHLYSAGRPSRWASAHIVVIAYKCLCELAIERPPQITVKQIFTGPKQFQEMILYWHRLLGYGLRAFIHCCCHCLAVICGIQADVVARCALCLGWTGRVPVPLWPGNL